VIVLDPGHEPSKGGAVSSCGVEEYKYNDEMVEALSRSLRDYRIILTREKDREVDVNQPHLKSHLNPEAQQQWEKNKTLVSRPAIANQARARFFISIHHDSVPESELIFDPALCQGKGGRRISDSFKNAHTIGFDIFVNDRAPSNLSASSLKLAELIGSRFIKAGRTASNYHLSPFEPCTSCRVVDAASGIYYKDLSVLRNIDTPAILIEIGNILDPEDEKRVRNNTFRSQVSELISDSLREYFK